MSYRKPIPKSKYDDSSNDISDSGSGDPTDSSFFSGTNPTEPGNYRQLKIPKYTKEDEEYDYEEDEQIKFPPPKKVAPAYKDEEEEEEEEKDTRKRLKQQSEEDDYEDEKVDNNIKPSEKEEEEEEEEEEQIPNNSRNKKVPAPLYKEEEDNEDNEEDEENNKSSSSPMNTVSEKFSTSNLIISPNGLNALEANVPQISSSSDDSSNNINQRYKIEKQKLQEEKEKQKQEKQQKKARLMIESSNEPQSDMNYSDNGEDIKSHSSRRKDEFSQSQNSRRSNNRRDEFSQSQNSRKSNNRKDEFSQSQASRKSHNVNADNESHSSRRHLHATFANINNDDNYIDNDYDQDQEIRRRHSAKSIASSHKSLRSTRSARSTKSIRSSRSARTNQTNQATSKRSLKSRQSITKDSWKDDVAKSVAQKENDRIDIILQTQYHINPEDIEIEIQEQVKKEYEDMIAKNCKTIYQNKEMLKEKMSKNHYLDLDSSSLKNFSRSEIAKFNEQISRDISKTQKELDEILAENKKIQKRINTLQTNSKEETTTRPRNRNGKSNRISATSFL